jgi:hypothetical protein
VRRSEDRDGRSEDRDGRSDAIDVACFLPARTSVVVGVATNALAKAGVLRRRTSVPIARRSVPVAMVSEDPDRRSDTIDAACSLLARTSVVVRVGSDATAKTGVLRRRTSVPIARRTRAAPLVLLLPSRSSLALATGTVVLPRSSLAIPTGALVLRRRTPVFSIVLLVSRTTTLVRARRNHARSIPSLHPPRFSPALARTSVEGSRRNERSSPPSVPTPRA